MSHLNTERPWPPNHVCGQVKTTGLFMLATVFLLLAALVIPHGTVSDVICWQILTTPLIAFSLSFIWLLVLIEGLIDLRHSVDKRYVPLTRLFMIALFPPLRMVVTLNRPAQAIWLPLIGWQAINKALFEKLERQFELPMLAVTLLTIPIMASRLLLAERIEQSPELALTLHIGTALIWFAFTFEFIIMVAVADKKLAYCKKNWINIVIIVLPLIGFLRMLRLFRVLRLARASKLTRAYRLRGLILRSQRIALHLNLLERLFFRNPEKFLQRLIEQEQEKKSELEVIQNKIQQVKNHLRERNPS